MKIQSISIQDAMSKIANNEILLPAIQREFVWKRDDIELMFDSILRDYPINTMMFWRINNISQQPLDFYSFLIPHFKSGATKNIKYNKLAVNQGNKLVVIDGQQRLTSLYIGLYGSYATQKGQKQFLYIRLDAKATKDDRFFDIKFMTDNKVKSLEKAGQTWLKMTDLQSTTNIFSLYPYLVNNNSEFTMNLLRKLDSLLSCQDYLNYYDITGCNNIDDALEVFTRTNNTGTKLSKGDLLLSVLTTCWAGKKNDNARDYVSGIISDVETIGFKIDRDWVIKCALVVFGNNIQTTVANFSSSQVANSLYTNRMNFRKAIIAAFTLARNGFEILEKSLTSKLAVIPIVYFIYKNRIWHIVNKANLGQSFATKKSPDYRNDIRKWLWRAIVQNLFEASTDEILKKVKSIIDNNGKKNYFPYSEIENNYPQMANIDYKTLLDTPKAYAFPILNIIYSGTRYLQQNLIYDVDHMHPASQFKNGLNSIRFTSKNDELLAKDGRTYNCVRNLQLLDRSSNRSKNKMALNKWIAAAGNPAQLRTMHFIPNTYDIESFKTFIDERSHLLENRLRSILS